LDRQSLWWDFYSAQETIRGWSDTLGWWKEWFANAWWPLNYLYTPFANAQSWTIWGAYKIWLVYDAIIWVLDSIPTLPNLESIRDWLLNQWGELRVIQLDPLGWVGERIPRAYSTSPYIHRDFYHWLQDWLFREARNLYNWWVDPWGTIKDLAYVYHIHFWAFLNDWFAWLDDRAPKAYPWSPGWLSNFPVWLDDWLRREWFDLWYAKTDFRQWLKTQLADHLPDVYDLLFATDIELEELLSTRWGWAFDAFKHPGDYLSRTLFTYYPDTAAILAAPGSYVWCKLKEYLDLYAEEQKSWIQRIATRILDALW